MSMKKYLLFVCIGLQMSSAMGAEEEMPQETKDTLALMLYAHKKCNNQSVQDAIKFRKEVKENIAATDAYMKKHQNEPESLKNFLLKQLSKMPTSEERAERAQFYALQSVYVVKVEQLKKEGLQERIVEDAALLYDTTEIINTLCNVMESEFGKYTSEEDFRKQMQAVDMKEKTNDIWNKLTQ